MERQQRSPGRPSLLRGGLYSLLIALLSLSAIAALGNNQPNRPIVFSLAEIAPWAEHSESGQPQGVLVELVDELRSRTGLPLTYQVRPYSRTLLELREGIADFVPSFAAPGVDAIGRPIGHLVTARLLVLARSGQDGIEGLEDLNGRNVGYLDGSWVEHALSGHERIKKVPVNSVAHGVRLLERERVSAVIVTDIALPERFGPDAESSSSLKVLFELAENDGYVYMSRKSSRDDAQEAIADALERMRKDGTLERLFASPFR